VAFSGVSLDRASTEGVSPGGVERNKAALDDAALADSFVQSKLPLP